MSLPIFTVTDTDLLKVGIAVFCGGVLGIERQYKNKIAGFRTIILICLGSTLFTIVAQKSGNLAAMNIVTGVGFIGAGVIFKDNIEVTGLTTAAVIWASAGIGMVDGAGDYLLAIIATFVILVVLITFGILERFLDYVHRDKLFAIEFANDNFGNLERVRNLVAEHHLKGTTVQVSKKNGCLHMAIWVTGHKKNLLALDEVFLKMPEITSF